MGSTTIGDSAPANALVAIVGATGTGKSELALELAQALQRAGQPAEIVNADAMQLYRGMDIGTAKVPLHERRGIPHHLFDVLEVTAEASVAAYQADARPVITGILNRGATPIMVGGSGLYVSSVIYDFQFPVTDAALRAELEAELAAHGPGMLYQRLFAADPDAARAIGPHNGRRIVRAIEVVQLTGQPFSSGLPDQAARWHSPTVTVGLRAPREALVRRLDERVRQMWAAGLLDEVRDLVPLGLRSGITASRAIGYAQALAQLDGELTEIEAIEATATLTRKYARRQVSWFKRYADTLWLDHGDQTGVEQALASVTRATAQ